MSKELVFGIACSCLVASGVGAVAPDADPPPARPMDRPALVQTLANWVQKLQGNGGQWRFVYEDVQMFLVTDQAADRMRIVAPIADGTILNEGQLRVLMEANFDRALDARYALYEGSVWSVFVHPLAELSEAELLSAIRQVAALHASYGTTFSSMDIVFGGAAEGDDDGGGDVDSDVEDD